MWLYEKTKAEVHYWLNPTPQILLSKYDDVFDHIDRVEMMKLEERRTIDYVDFDESMIEKIKEKVEACRVFYASLEEERKEF